MTKHVEAIYDAAKEEFEGDLSVSPKESRDIIAILATALRHYEGGNARAVAKVVLRALNLVNYAQNNPPMPLGTVEEAVEKEVARVNKLLIAHPEVVKSDLPDRAITAAIIAIPMIQHSGNTDELFTVATMLLASLELADQQADHS